MQKIALLYNSFSGRGRGKRLALTIEKLLQLKSKEFISFENNWPNVIEDFTEIWVIGGDGTMNYLINKYETIDKPVALFPGGTGNDIHWKIYGKISLEDQVEKVLNGQIRKVDTGICNGEKFINTIGLGFDGEVLKDMSLVRKVGGHIGYLLIVIKKIFTYKEKVYEFELNNRQYKQSCLLFLVSNSSRTGGGFLVSPKAEIDDGLLNVIFTTKCSLLERLLLLPKVERGKHLKEKNVSHHLCEQLSLISEEEIYYQLDGELRKAKEFEVRIVKASLRIKV